MTQTQETKALGRIVELVRDLRKRCSWDAAQTRETLRPYLVEEVLELDRAIGDGSESDVRAELGDLLLHVGFQIVLGEEAKTFGAEDLVRAVEEKMWRRHPHLFNADGTVVAPGAEARSHPGWERQKKLEDPDGSILDGLPRTMPALLMAYRLQEKAAGVGFDWPDQAGPRAKVSEELQELDEELAKDGPPPDRVSDEIGDLLFAVVNLARKVGTDPRSALEGTNRRFRERFKQLERMAREDGVDLHSANLETLDGFWDRAKAEEKTKKNAK